MHFVSVSQLLALKALTIFEKLSGGAIFDESTGLQFFLLLAVVTCTVITILMPLGSMVMEQTCLC